MSAKDAVLVWVVAADLDCARSIAQGCIRLGKQVCLGVSSPRGKLICGPILSSSSVTHRTIGFQDVRTAAVLLWKPRSLPLSKADLDRGRYDWPSSLVCLYRWGRLSCLFPCSPKNTFLLCSNALPVVFLLSEQRACAGTGFGEERTMVLVPDPQVGDIWSSRYLKQ